MMIVSYVYHATLFTSLSPFAIAFYFGFDRNEISYNEARDAGQQKIKYSPAPGNKTEKSFMFLLFIYVCMGNIEMGGKLCLIREPILWLLWLFYR